MGREWNDKLRRRLQDSVVLASDRPKVTRLLLTDLTHSDLTLVEVLGENEQVVAEFLVRPAKRPKELRYREERLLAGLTKKR